MIQRALKPFEPHIYTALRVLAGLLLTIHGAQKLFGILGGHSPEMFSQLWVGAVIELVCGLMVAVGLYASIGAFLLSGTMAVAYTQFHWQFAFDEKFFPMVNKGELAIVYAFVFLFIAARGGGKLALRGR